MFSSKEAGSICSNKNLEGKVAFITGPTSGIGLITAQQLAVKGCHVILAGRSLKSLESTVNSINSMVMNNCKDKDTCKMAKVDIIQMDLTSLNSIQQAFQKFLLLNLPLHYLILNAGGINESYKTANEALGIEEIAASNHLGHFYLTSLFLEILKKNNPSRIIVLSSEAHRNAKITKDNYKKLFYDEPANYSPFYQYANSKLANALFARTLARKLAGSGVTAYSLHPGVVATGIARNLNAFSRSIMYVASFFMKTPSQGAATTMYCLLQDGIEQHSGAYFQDCDIAKTSNLATDDELGDLIWNYSEELIDQWKKSNTSNSNN